MVAALKDIYKKNACQTHCFESKQELRAWLAELKQEQL